MNNQRRRSESDRVLDKYLYEETDLSRAQRLASYYHLNYSVVVDIMEETGYGPEGAVELAIQREDLKWFKLKGKMYSSVTDACNELGVDVTNVYNISTKVDLDLTEALQLYTYLLAIKSHSDSK